MVRLYCAERMWIRIGGGTVSGDRWAWLFEQAAEVRVPAALLPSTVRERFGPPSSWRVQPGQVWRASGDEATVLVYLTAVADGRVHAAPVTVGTTHATAGSAVVDSAGVAFEGPLAVWLPSVRDISWGALDEPIDDWSGPVANWLSDPGRVQAPVGCHIETTDAPFLSSAWAELEDALAELDELATEFAAQSEGDAVPTGAVQLTELQPSDIARWLGISTSDAQKLRRGYVDPSPDQMAVLAREVGREVGSRSRVPGEMYDGASHPRYRGAVDRLSSKWHSGIAATQRRLAQESYALAARQTGTGVGWDALIEAYIASELGDVPGQA